MDGLTGVASGIDTSAIADQLMQIERQPRTRMDWQKAAITTRQTDLSTIQSKLIAHLGRRPGGYDVQVLGLARAEVVVIDEEFGLRITEITAAP
jgi:hypothetical protein